MFVSFLAVLSTSFQFVDHTYSSITLRRYHSLRDYAKEEEYYAEGMNEEWNEKENDEAMNEKMGERMNEKITFTSREVEAIFAHVKGLVKMLDFKLHDMQNADLLANEAGILVRMSAMVMLGQWSSSKYLCWHLRAWSCWGLSLLSGNGLEYVNSSLISKVEIIAICRMAITHSNLFQIAVRMSAS
ncbi:hypothetical protein HHK36_005802 [Tetracentron sinense]|uniref:Uncharacterized protein n=1 Tax=Tetracentron sinense TaxID=13715 RepID=A0A835DMK8_TETSI|nr:hypothetical protein HHK36_005802 [Tetracentron sinense]